MWRIQSDRILPVLKADNLSPRAEKRSSTDRKPKEKRWEQILQAAAEVFYEKGYDAATLQDIADRVGILKGSIYYYIKAKGDLLEHLLIEVHNEGLEMITERAQAPGTVFEKLDGMIVSQVNYVCRNQIKTTVYLHELASLAPEKRDALFGTHDFRDLFQVIIKAGQAEGLILPRLDATLTAQTLLGWINSVYQWYRPHPKRPIKLIADHFVTLLLRGIATPEGLKLLSKV
jgi:AcrR family transcriptional regulator